MKCSSCLSDKEDKDFPYRNGKRWGRVCKGCKNIKQKIYRETCNNIHSRTYEKTDKGYLVRTYRNMKSRTSGILKNKAHLYEGLELLDKETFYTWSLNNTDFQRLLEEYRLSGFDFRLAPSIDRKDPNKGYTLENIRWITHSENSSNVRRNKTKSEHKK